jgi:hypothetical protein
MKTKTAGTVDFESLKSNPNNPRTISDEQKQMLLRSLKEFGDLSGIVLNKRTGQLVGGHQRVDAFRNTENDVRVEIRDHLASPDITGTIAFGYVHVNGTRYSYREVDWDESRETMANLAANKMGGEFVFDEVARILGQLELDSKNDLSLTGFTNTEILSLMEGLNQPLGLEEMVAPSDAINFVIRCENMTEMNELQQRIGLDGFRTDQKTFLNKLDEMTK